MEEIMKLWSEQFQKGINFFRTIRGIEFLTLSLDFVGIGLTSIPLWLFTKPIKLTPYLGGGVHYGHQEIQSVINEILDNFGRIKWMRFGLAILVLNMGLKYVLWRKKAPTDWKEVR
jgi:hypothetical protein